MAREIERKFLPKNEAWRNGVSRSVRMSQGYIAGSERASVRVRIAGDEAWLNIKSGRIAASRHEYEYSIPVADARELLELSSGKLIDKTRHFVEYEGFEWEVDEFHGDNRGLVVAELELDSEQQPFPRPGWIGVEVTHLPRYYNVLLVDRPYSVWTDAERTA